MRRRLTEQVLTPLTHEEGELPSSSLFLLSHVVEESERERKGTFL